MGVITTEIFIQRARAIHGDKYDYSKTEYIGQRTKVCIICPEHGEFWQRPDTHIGGADCPSCAKITGKSNLRKWNKETCYNEAKKYKSRSEFISNAESAYRVARQNNWLVDYTWLEVSKKPSGYWTEETCREEARKYKTRSEFAKNADTAYRLASVNGWINQYDWFVQGCTPAGFWTYEKCYAIAKQFSSKKEFLEKNPNAYHKASHSKWLDSFDWLSTKFVWTYELCFKEAQKYETKSAFGKGASGAYGASLKNGWIKDYVWMVDNRVNIVTDKIDNVYAYYFEKYNAIYVGRTINIKRRDHEHILNVDNDAVAKFAHEKKCAVPPMIILEDHLTLAEGQEKEDYWVKHYAALGYNILNSAKTGLGIGSLGSLLSCKWSREKCYNEAKKYTSRKEFQIESVGAYTRALKRGWLDDYTWFSSPKTGQHSWTYEACYEEAQRYTNLSAFHAQSSAAYTKAHKKGWLVDYTWLGVIIVEKKGKKYHVQEGQVTIWNRESCYEEAKKYTTRKQFEIGSAGAYKRARLEGWLNDYTWFVNGHAIEGQRRKKWDYEKCYEEAKKYHSRKEFQYGKGSSTAYKTARANGWLDDYTWFRTPPKPDGYWTYERCFEVARKYSYMADFKKENPSVDVIARRNGWIKDYTWLIKKKKHWSYEECAAYAKRHQKASQFKLACPSAYVAAVENNWLKEFFPENN